MRVFVSSLIGGFEAERAAARSAITTLRNEPVMAEDFGAQPTSPQVACLQGLRSADLVILILGDRYGDVQDSGLSATHEEYREARESKPIIAFVREGLSAELAQQALIKEVEEWEGGLLRGSFADAEELRTLITQALHDYELATARTPVDTNALKSKAAEMLPQDARTYYSGQGPVLSICIAGGPPQQVIRAAVIDEEIFGDKLQQAAQFGSKRLLDPSGSTERRVENDRLVLKQESGASVSVDEGANLLLQVPLGTQDRHSRMSQVGVDVIIEEDATAALRNCFELANHILEEVDKTQRISHLAVAITVTNAQHHGWRTRAEHQSNPHSIEIPMFGSRDREPLAVDFPRPALRVNQKTIVEDLAARLRRQWRSR